MDEEKIENLLCEARNQIPIDNEFKKSLRKSFESKKRVKRKFKSKALFGIVTAAILFLAFLMTNLQSRNVNANELMITNAISFVDIAQGDIIALEHQQNNLYVAVEEEGIFKSTENGLEKIAGVKADSISVNTKETKLLFSNKGTIYIYDLNTDQQTILLESKGNINYSIPVWKNNNEIYFIKQTETENQLILMSINTKDEKLIASGIGSAFDITEEFIVYENGKKIIKLDLKTDTKMFVDNGNSPSVSKNGRYITYIKKEDGLEDVWIVDADLQTKKKVTTNLQQRDSNYALYQYSSPIWDSEKNILYLIKNRMFGTEMEDIRLTKIELGTQKLTAQETVERFMQALIVRDDDFAKSLMNEPPEFLTFSNPSVKGYKIISTNEAGEFEQIQAAVTLVDSHLPYEVTLILDFKLKQMDDRYKIQEITEVSSTELSSSDMENMDLTKDNKTLNLFSLKDIRTRSEITNSNIRFSSVTINLEKKVVYFGVQEMFSELNQKFGVTLWSYDIQSRQFTFLDRIDKIESHQDIVLEGMTLSPDGKYLAVDLFSEATFTPYLSITNLEKQDDSYGLKQSHSLFWRGNRLYYELHGGSKITLHEYNVETINKH